MCGIAGYWGEGNEEILSSMVDAVSYRGPDDKGVLIQGGIGMAQRRLSIIDVSSSGHQPMSNEDGTITIVFNGEIYNYENLRSELLLTHDFIGRSDTEVIVHLYEEIGESVFSRLEGMFAIALYDSNKNKLYLARDRMGKKPLYWSISENSFLFGSELKVLMKHPAFKKEIDLESLNKYFAYEYIPTPHSIFKNTFKLEPGCFLVWDGKKSEKKIFWEPSFLPKTESFSKSLEALGDTLSSAVKDRLVSADVPIGVFLSGGLDSSTIAYYAAKSGLGKIKTFSIGFKESTFDESVYAREVADFLGTEHYEKILSIEDGIGIISKIGDCLDEPMADSSILPTYLLSKFAREYVTVALGGDGSDELFAGYDTITALFFARFYQMIPKFIRTKLIAPVIRMLPTLYSNMSLDFKLKKFTENFEGNKNYLNQRWLDAWSEKERSRLFEKNITEKLKDKNVYEDIDRYISGCDSSDFFDQQTLLFERMYMMDGVLVKVDRASMMNSLEVRAPFLDTRVVNLANHLPEKFKFKGLERKFILKRLMNGKLPYNIIYRKKKGFGVPVAEWFRKELKPFLEDYLSEKSIKSMELFNYKYIQKILNEHFEGRKDNRKQIWSLLVFAMWWRKWIM
ncbi:asparagine synthase (glutamine-hydrolyzing) [Patescibacteria group bacterium]|nr:asparagine synthase (glutamine-hydrolyzing) [Patescibacteria group bacterium]